MEFKVRTSPVISSAHGRTSLFDVPEVPFLTILLAQMFAVFGPSALCQHLPASNGKLAGRAWFEPKLASARCGKELVGQLRARTLGFGYRSATVLRSLRAMQLRTHNAG